MKEVKIKMEKTYDFAGWATRNDLLCGDGRTIRHGAFKDNDGTTVPLVWNHDHKNPEAVLGHALLENRDEGVYAYCTFNDTPAGQNAKELVQHGDVRSLSIWANKLKQVGNDVIHGMIRELSLVLAGANPGATIDFVMAHSDDESDEVYANYDESALVIYHSDEKSKKGAENEVAEETKKPETSEEKVEEKAEGKTVGEVFETLTEEQKEAVYFMLMKAREEAAGKTEDSEKEVKHSDDEQSEESDPTVAEVFETLSEKQQNAVYAVVNDILGDDDEEDDENEEEVQHSDEDDSDETIGDILATLNEDQQKAVQAIFAAAEAEANSAEVQHSDEDEESEENETIENEDDDDEEEVAHSDLGGEEVMKTNVFDKETKTSEVLSHSEMETILEEAQRCGSFKEAILSHGIENIELMFPDAKALENEPGFIKRNDDWVAKVLGGVHHSPFARIKTIFADITAAQARAKGYQKGKLKIEEVFKLLKRVTNPTTIYKKQSLDRDDIIDVNFNVLPWLKSEIRMMLNEELARAILIGDGRDPVEEADDKIDEECIRPIWKMEDLFTVKVAVPVAAAATADEKAKAFIKAAIKSRKSYKGSGNPDMFMSEDMLTDCLLIEDVNGRVIYDSVAKLAAVLRVREIISVPVMEGLTRTDDDGNTFDLAAIYVNLKDYNVGTDKGGEVNFFDDFDIDFNKQKYLMETRCSGSLTKPYSAVAIEFQQAK